MARPTAKRINEVRWTKAAISKKRRRAAAAAAGGGVGRRIRMLRELVPGCGGGGGAKEMGLEGLFREAAYYIAHLRVQVEVMQMVLRELSPPEAQADGGDDDDEDGD